MVFFLVLGFFFSFSFSFHFLVWLSFPIISFLCANDSVCDPDPSAQRRAGPGERGAGFFPTLCPWQKTAGDKLSLRAIRPRVWGEDLIAQEARFIL